MPAEHADHEHEGMLAEQIAARGIRNPHVLAAMAAVPRHHFVPDNLRESAYRDQPLPIGLGQTISQPYIVGLMTELLDLQAEDRVLEIGTGSGYQAAILSHLAAEIYTVERHPELAEHAKLRMQRLGYGNVQVVCTDGTLGYPAKAPYDAIIVTAAAPSIPPALLKQLGQGGRLLCPVGERHVQRLIKVIRTESGLRETPSIDCVFVPLLGEAGWQVSGNTE